jgi:hypothetical protein
MTNPHLHRRKCSAGHREGLRTDEYQERKDQKSKDKKWKACSCPIVMSGTLDRFDRRTTAEWDWEKARQVATARETAESWDGVAITKPEIPSAIEHGIERKTVADATKRFLAIRFPANTTASDAIQGKFGLLMRRLDEFSEQHGLVMIDQWGGNPSGRLHAHVGDLGHFSQTTNQGAPLHILQVLRETLD